MAISKTNIPLKDRTRLPWRVLAILFIATNSFIITSLAINLFSSGYRYIEIPASKEYYAITVKTNKNNLITKTLSEVPGKSGQSILKEITSKEAILYLNSVGEVIGYKEKRGDLVTISDSKLDTFNKKVPFIKRYPNYLITKDSINGFTTHKDFIKIRLGSKSTKTGAIQGNDISTNHQLSLKNKDFVSNIQSFVYDSEENYLQLKAGVENSNNPLISTIISSYPGPLSLSNKNIDSEILSNEDFSTKSNDIYTTFRKGEASLTLSGSQFTLSNKDINYLGEGAVNHCEKTSSSYISVNSSFISDLGIKRHSFLDLILKSSDCITFDTNSINICHSVDNLWKTP